MGNVEHNISLYSDNSLLFLWSPKPSVPSILTIFIEFSTISGYNINLSISEAIPLGTLNNTDTLSNIFFKWPILDFTCLGSIARLEGDKET